MQILHVFFLQDFQDLALNLVDISCKSCAKNEAFLSRYKNLAMILQEKLQDNFLVRFFLNLARKTSLLVKDLQDICKI